MKAKAAAELATLKVQKAAILEEKERAASEGARTKAAISLGVEKAMAEKMRLWEIKAKA